MFNAVGLVGLRPMADIGNFDLNPFVNGGVNLAP